MTINQQITESLGQCWHDWYFRGADYLNDPAACVDLWKVSGIDSVTKSNNHWTARRYFGKTIEGGGVEVVPEYTRASTFCEAICLAYLKSQGITPEYAQSTVMDDALECCTQNTKPASLEAKARIKELEARNPAQISSHINSVGKYKVRVS